MSSNQKILTGLSSKEVEKKQKHHGFNELPSSKSRNIFSSVLEVVKEPMFILLIICASLYAVLGDKEEALMLLVSVIFVIGITFYQERKTEKALDALKDLASPRALVIRDGQQIVVPGRELVVDDILILAEGDRVPADAVVLESLNLTVEESLLTGEPIPVRKSEWDGKRELDQPGGDDLPFVYSGTMVTQGRAYAKVIAIGVKTELGKIGKSIQEIKQEDTNLKKETAKIVKTLFWEGLVLCLLIIIVFGLTRGDFIKGILAGITFAMSALPEEFPVVLTVFFALGAWRISKKNVLTRRVSAIEALGSATVLCTDKTGTLTENKMAIEKVYCPDDYFILDAAKKEIEGKFKKLFKYGILASNTDPFDPMEKAIVKSEKFLSSDERDSKKKLVKQYSLSKELMATSYVWDYETRNELVVACKGAPEAVLSLCEIHHDAKQKLLAVVEEMAEEGLRVLAVARGALPKGGILENQQDLKLEFLGFLGFSDPIRPTVADAVQECYQAGIRVIMITGDYPVTAQKIAQKIGLKNAVDFISGFDLDKMPDKILRERIKKICIFARVVPEQKLRIVNALKANGEIVAMTGDGVNDAPALKASHIGVAMGERGTDVAREAAALVLLDDNFSSIVLAVRQGRRIFDNLRKAMTYILSIHIPIAGLSLIPVFSANLPIVFWPIHIAILELIIDPTCSIVFEAEEEEKSIMNKPPRLIDEPMFGFKKIIISIIQGFSVLAIVGAVYGVSIWQGKIDDEVRTLTFVTLIVASLGLTMTNRSWERTIIQGLKVRNKALFWVTASVAIMLTLVLYNPWVRNLFYFAPLSFYDLLLCLFAGGFSIAWFEIFKMINRNKKIKNSL